MSDAVATPGRRRLLPEERREEILASATDLISAVGFNATTLDDFAQAAGISRPGLLYHFASKESLLEGVLARRDLLDVEDAMREHAATTPAEARALMTALVERNTERRRIVQLYAILSAEALASEHPAHAYFRERQGAARERFARGVLAWHEDPDAAAVQLIAVLDGLQLAWLRDASIDMLAQWDRFAESFFVVTSSAPFGPPVDRGSHG